MTLITRSIRFCLRYAHSVCCVLYAHTVGLPFRRPREFIRLTNRHFGFVRFDADNAPPLLIPEVGIGEITQNGQPVITFSPEPEEGGISPLELLCVNRLTARLAPQRIFEIGTFNGKTTVNLAANMNPMGTVLTLDLPLQKGLSTVLRAHPWDEDLVASRESGRHFRDSVYASRILQLWGDSASFDYGPYQGTIDLVFVDGSHSYDYVMSDSRKAITLLRGGKGSILWHDYGTAWHDVTRALNELYKSDSAFSMLRRIRGTSLVVREST
jgi:hypothetical protein